MKKKLVSLILTAAMVLSLGACGQTGGETASSAPAAAETQEAASEASSGEETAASQEASAETAAAAEAGTYPIVDEPITVTGLVVGKDTATRSDRLVWNKVSEVTGINNNFSESQ